MVLETKIKIVLAIVVLYCTILVKGASVSHVNYQESSRDPDELLITTETRRFPVPKSLKSVKETPLNGPISQYTWYEQKLDHFNKTDTRRWPQRYFEHGGYYKPGGPIFLKIDGEGSGLPSQSDLINEGSMIQYAKEQGAFIIALEHRFYGQSHPTLDVTEENLKYLNIHQAIDDISSFISWFKAISGLYKNKWVLFGTSYGGSLAKWFSQAYPNMTDIIVVSSAPLELRYEMPEYLDEVTFIINQTSPQCLRDLTDGFECLEHTINGQPCGDYHHQYQSPVDLQNLFNLCEELNPENEFDATGLFFTLFNIFNNIVVNNIPDPNLSVSLDAICKSLSISSGQTKDSRFPIQNSPLVRLARVVKEISQASGSSNCIAFSLDKIVRYLDEDTSWNSPASLNGDRQFQWQRCNELGWVKGSREPKLPFGKRISSAFHAEVCRRVYGLTERTMRQEIDAANKEFKGKQIETQCGIYINGQDDPWNMLGVTSEDQVGQCNRAILIEGASHAKDKGTIQTDTASISYPPSLKPAQKEVGNIIDTWLKTGNCCKSKAYNGRTINTNNDDPRTVIYPAIPAPDSQRSNTRNGQVSLERSIGASRYLSTVPLTDPALSGSRTKPFSPSNDIDLEESKKVETRNRRQKYTDEIEIQNGVPFKEIAEFIKMHESRFFNPEAENNRFRVRVRNKNDKQTGQQTFSKFGIKIRMIQSQTEKTKSNTSELWDNPQWNQWTDFDTRQIITPNQPPRKINHPRTETLNQERGRKVIELSNSKPVSNRNPSHRHIPLSKNTERRDRSKTHHSSPTLITPKNQQHKNDKIPLSEWVNRHRLYHKQRNSHPQSEHDDQQKDLLVIKRKEKPQPIPLDNSDSNESDSSEKTHKSKGLKSKSKTPNVSYEEDSSSDEIQEYIKTAERTHTSFRKHSHEREKSSLPKTSLIKTGDDRSETKYWHREPTIYTIGLNHPTEKSFLPRSNSNRWSSGQGDLTLKSTLEEGSLESIEGSKEEYTEDDTSNSDEIKQDKETYQNNRKPGNIFKQKDSSEYEKALSGTDDKIPRIKQKDEEPEQSGNQKRQKSSQKRHPTQVGKIQEDSRESSTHRPKSLHGETLKIRTYSLDNPTEDFLRSKDLLNGDFKPKSTRLKTVGNVDKDNPRVENISQDHQNKQQTQKDKKQIKRTFPMKLITLRDSRGNKFPVPLSALDWRRTGSLNPPQEQPRFIDMSAAARNKVTNLALTAHDVAWVNLGVPLQVD